MVEETADQSLQIPKNRVTGRFPQQAPTTRPECPVRSTEWPVNGDSWGETELGVYKLKLLSGSEDCARPSLRSSCQRLAYGEKSFRSDFQSQDKLRNNP